MDTLNLIVDLIFLVLAPFIGMPVGWIIRHGRKVADARITWDNPVYEQIEDFVTLALAIAVGALIMVIVGLVYVWWMFNHFVVIYQTMGLTTVIQQSPILAIAYWSVVYFLTHMFAWLWKQPKVGQHEEQKGG